MMKSKIKYWDSLCMTCKNSTNGCVREEFCMDYDGVGIVIDQLVMTVAVKDGKVVSWSDK
jgi:hypothetical protein